MKPFKVEETIKSEIDILTIYNDDYIIEVWIDNDDDSFSSLELIEMTSSFMDISHLEIITDEVHYYLLNNNFIIHYPMDKIILKDKDDDIIFKIDVEHEENSLVPLVYLKVTKL